MKPCRRGEKPDPKADRTRGRRTRDSNQEADRAIVNGTVSHKITSNDGDLRTQYGAICWRRKGDRIDVLLVTSRDTGRWIIPKGWPVKGLSPEGSAAMEAFEEAGVEGEVSPVCVGVYSYDKTLGKGPGPLTTVPCVVAVYPLRVHRLLARYPESHERQRKWFPAAKAATKVAEPELRALLEQIAASVDLGPSISDRG